MKLLAPTIRPGESVAALVRVGDGAMLDILLHSTDPVPLGTVETRTVGVLKGGAFLELYFTTHMDSGRMMSSVAAKKSSAKGG